MASDSEAPSRTETSSATSLFRGVETTKERHVGYNWMVGETCWPSFARRVMRTYGFTATSDMQRWLDTFIRQNTSLNPTLRTRLASGDSGQEAGEPICASKHDHVCVWPCRPTLGVLHAGQSTFTRIPARGSHVLGLSSRTTMEGSDEVPAGKHLPEPGPAPQHKLLARSRKAGLANVSRDKHETDRHFRS